MPLAAGTRLGPYETLAPIGAGGMGEVYRAYDPRMGRDVAVKISGERFSDRFSREVRAVAALNHPNICHLYDVGPNYLVMELVEGPTLAERIQQGPIPLERDEGRFTSARIPKWGRRSLSRPTGALRPIGPATAASCIPPAPPACRSRH
jgi:serine/threonine protein kinase